LKRDIQDDGRPLACSMDGSGVSNTGAGRGRLLEDSWRAVGYVLTVQSLRQLRQAVGKRFRLGRAVHR
jgi:hypothetical protein